MHSTVFVLLCSFIAVSSLALQGSNSSVSPPLDCGCVVKGLDFEVKYWTWLDVESGFSPRKSIQLTKTIITVVNTVLDETKTVTELPPQVTHPPTNSLGTRIETITYVDHESQSHTTVVTYPTAFIFWPDHYVVEKDTTTDSNGQCTGITTETVWVTSNPQPPSGSCPYPFNCSSSLTDPKGLSHTLVFDIGESYWELKIFSSLFPDQPYLSSCDNANLGPNWGGFTQTRWYTKHLVVTTGDYSHPPPTSSSLSRNTGSIAHPTFSSK
ncbi:hypothetical protein F4808DRAFT_421702 [Astrocystis sublimbata]|nr:hypothetical protein F4808DRAFT_421702 [Astrocystis sublimbata]